MSTFFWPKVSKKSQKSQKSIFLISTVGKLLGKVDLHLGIVLDLTSEKVLPDVAKALGQKVTKVAKKCYQMWQKVAKGVLSGSKRFQGLPRASKGHGLSRPPTGSHGLPRATTEF